MEYWLSDLREMWINLVCLDGLSPEEEENPDTAWACKHLDQCLIQSSRLNQPCANDTSRTPENPPFNEQIKTGGDCRKR